MDNVESGRCGCGGGGIGLPIVLAALGAIAFVINNNVMVMMENTETMMDTMGDVPGGGELPVNKKRRRRKRFAKNRIEILDKLMIAVLNGKLIFLSPDILDSKIYVFYRSRKQQTIIIVLYKRQRNMKMQTQIRKCLCSLLFCLGSMSFVRLCSSSSLLSSYP